MSTKVVKELLVIPTVLTNQMNTKGYIKTFLGGDSRIQAKLVDLVIEEDYLVLDLCIYWRQWLAGDFIVSMEEAPDEQKGVTWKYNQVYSKFRIERSFFSEDDLRKFGNLELFWSSFEKKKDIPFNKRPWLLSNGEQARFKLVDRKAKCFCFMGATFTGQCFGGEAVSYAEGAELEAIVDNEIHDYSLAAQGVSTPAQAPAVPTTGVTAEAIAFPARK